MNSKSSLITTKKKGLRWEYALTDGAEQEIGNLATVLNQQQIADFLNISVDTFKRMLKKDENLMHSYKKGKSNGILTVASSLLKNCRKGNVAAQIFFLKTQAGWSEQDIVKHQHTGDFGLVVHKLAEDDLVDLQDPKIIDGVDFVE